MFSEDQEELVAMGIFNIILTMNKVTKLFIATSCCLIILHATAQDYTADNRLYKTIDWNAFLEKLEKNADLIFFDIRTPGERSDTSKYSANNQGRIKGAIQTDYFDFNKYYPEYLKHKDDTIYLYCSHSMRSRRLAKRLADSSFSKVVNVNGGMSYLNLYGEKRYPLRKKYYETSNRYGLVSPLDLKRILKDKSVQIIDIRSDSVYNGTSKSEADNSVGTIEGVVHLPKAQLLKDASIVLDAQKKILLVDNWCDESPDVAKKLIALGYGHVSVLLFGLSDLIDRIPSSKRSFLKTRYPIILPEELLSLRKKNEVTLVDIRTITEYTNTDTLAWKNVGRLKDAIHIPPGAFTKAKFDSLKEKPIVIYDIMAHDELYEAALKLKAYGLENFSLMAGGIYFVHWKIANEHMENLRWLVDK